MCYYIWLLILFMVIFSSAKLFQEGHICMSHNGNIGTCKKLTNCLQAIRDIFRTNVVITKCDPFFTTICCDDESRNMNWIDPYLTGPRAYWTNLEEPNWVDDRMIEPGPNLANSGQIGSQFGKIFTTTTLTTQEEAREYGIKSEEKCKEYSSWKDFWSKKMTKKCSNMDSKIIGGKKASAYEFPHMAKLIFENTSDAIFGCGASLISEQYLLTAAHCIQGSTEPIVAVLGAGRRKTQITIKVAKIIPHPNYIDVEREDHELYHDIALLRLERPIMEFNNYIRPACLQIGDFIKGKRAVATGWGIKDTTRWKASRHLLKVTLPLYDHSRCKQIYKEQENLSKGLDENSMICAGDVDRNTCQGDSGGPLQTKKKCMYTIIGVTSFGQDGCAGKGIYTRVSYYLPWIESVVWPDKK